MSDDRREGGEPCLIARRAQPLTGKLGAEGALQAGMQRQVIENHHLDQLLDRVGPRARSAHYRAVGAEIADLLAGGSLERRRPALRIVEKEEGRRDRRGVAMPGELV